MHLCVTVTYQYMQHMCYTLKSPVVIRGTGTRPLSSGPAPEISEFDHPELRLKNPEVVRPFLTHLLNVVFRKQLQFDA